MFQFGGKAKLVFSSVMSNRPGRLVCMKSKDYEKYTLKYREQVLGEPKKKTAQKSNSSTVGLNFKYITRDC
jgi:hypothetical protein